MAADEIILGIDPGTLVMGYGVIGISRKVITLKSMGIVQMNPKEDHTTRLKRIFDRTIILIDTYFPDVLAIEAPFYGKNVQSMLKLGRAQGVAIAAALSRSIPVYEYAPRKIKQSITGNGNASKEQVAAMLQRLMKIEETSVFLDATDGLAVGVCHHFQSASIASSGNGKGWKSFISQNPERISSPGKSSPKL
jgi:crossover junction endodeoxyribonuclease RuvC